MWFVFALLTTFAWGCADLFYKRGNNYNDSFSHYKTVIMVGLIMGIHGTGYMLIEGISFDPSDMLKYLPVSLFYIISMAVGYFGLRFIELSISSPVQNSSGAVTAILLFIFFPHDLGFFEISGIIIISLSVFALALLEKRIESKARKLSGEVVDKKYQISILAITFPIIYMLLDGLGTFFDGIYLDEMELISEDAALLAYEFTFLLVAIICFIYLKLKNVPFHPFRERDKGFAAIFETIGQFFYVFAMSGKAIVAAPLIASYSIVSVLLARIFLKEKLSKQHYIIITIVLFGIIMLGISDEL